MRAGHEQDRGVPSTATASCMLNSAVCTHLGCHVHWNSTEQCWDCPCHGSHFAPDGAVLNGPAIYPLEPSSLKPASLKSEAKAKART